MSFTDARTVSHAAVSDPTLFNAQIAGLIDNPIADVKATAAADDTTPREVVLQLRDRLNNPWKARMWVLLTFGTVAWDDTADQTITITSSASATALVPDRLYLVLTNADGTITLEIDSTEDEIHMSSSVIGRAQTATITLSAAPAPAPHPVSLLTRLSPLGIPGRRCGSFAGR